MDNDQENWIRDALETMRRGPTDEYSGPKALKEFFDVLNALVPPEHQFNHYSNEWASETWGRSGLAHIKHAVEHGAQMEVIVFLIGVYVGKAKGPYR